MNKNFQYTFSVLVICLVYCFNSFSILQSVYKQKNVFSAGKCFMMKKEMSMQQLPFNHLKEPLTKANDIINISEVEKTTTIESKFFLNKKIIAKLMLSVAFFLSPPDVLMASEFTTRYSGPSTSTTATQGSASGIASKLESSIAALETAEDRGTTLQALADVFEAAGSKTLLVRTKYKTRIISAVNTKHVALSNQWDQALSYASGELKRRVDPFRTVDLQGYLSVAPVVGGAVYLGALAVQQLLPELFGFAYPFGVFVFAAPILFIIITT